MMAIYKLFSKWGSNWSELCTTIFLWCVFSYTRHVVPAPLTRQSSPFCICAADCSCLSLKFVPVEQHHFFPPTCSFLLHVKCKFYKSDSWPLSVTHGFAGDWGCSSSLGAVCWVLPFWHSRLPPQVGFSDCSFLITVVTSSKPCQHQKISRK